MINMSIDFIANNICRDRLQSLHCIITHDLCKLWIAWNIRNGVCWTWFVRVRDFVCLGNIRWTNPIYVEFTFELCKYRRDIFTKTWWFLPQNNPKIKSNYHFDTVEIKSFQNGRLKTRRGHFWTEKVLICFRRKYRVCRAKSI